MQPVDVYHDQHQELAAMVEDLRPLLNEKSLKIRPVISTTRKLLREITGKLRDHLHGEDKELYPSLLAHEDDDIRTAARDFISGQHALRQWTEQYHKKWLRDDDRIFDDRFIADTNELLTLLAARVDREERFLFPRLQAKVESKGADG